MNTEQRKHEFKTRQVWYGSSMVAKLNSVDGHFIYSVYLWNDPDIRTTLPKDSPEGERRPVKIENKFLVLANKYQDEDPEDLFKLAEKIVGKWHCGRQYQQPTDMITGTS